MDLQIKPFSENDEKSVIEYYTDHEKFHEGDSGLDLFALCDITVNPGETCAIHFGISCQAFSHNGDLCSYLLLPRSSISKTPLRMSNSVGLIDAGYRGEIMAMVDNIKDYIYEIKTGDRLFQLVAPNLGEIRYSLITELLESTRGEGGFGSTGK